MALVRLQKFMAESGCCSRRKAEEYIVSGKVSVNGVFITRLGIRVDPQKDDVVVDGKVIVADSNKRYLAVNKPVGYTCTTRTFKSEKNILRLLPKKERWIIVGRLDKNSEGLLLVTTDGGFAHTVTHPRNNVEKEYVVCVSGKLRKSDLARIRNGIVLDDGIVKPLSVMEIGLGEFRIVLGEGRKREIRRLCEMFGYRVEKLKRVRIGELRLGNLPIGKYKAISAEDVLGDTLIQRWK